MNTIIHNLGKEIKTITKEGCSHKDLTDWINNGDVVNNFIGWVEVTDLELDTDVPIEFEQFDRMTPVMVEEQYTVTEITIDEETGEPVSLLVEKTRMIPLTEEVDGEEVIVKRPKTFREYSVLVYDSTNEGKFIIPVGVRNKHGNRHESVDNTELRIWIAYFGIDKIKTKSEGSALISRETSDD